MKTWIDELTLSDSLSVLKGLAISSAREGGSVGSAIASLIEAEDWAAVVNFDLNYFRAWDVLQLIACRQALAYFQKFEPLDIGVDKTQVAFEKFMAGESKCKSVNNVLRKLRLGGETNFSLNPRVVTLIESARRKLRHLLGPCPEIRDLRLAFGPGATTSIKRLDSCPMNKMASGLQCSTDLLASGLLPSLLREVPHWTASLENTSYGIDEEGWLYESVAVDLHHGVLKFVPKNAKTYRSIQVEPSLNTFLQKGIGSYMEKRLRHAGLDIRNQQRNALMARRGSLTGDLATLDLSSASDLISYELVRLLLPDDWFALLSAARTSTVQYKGQTYCLEKFSSMGNGFTFPLETAIFWAITVSSLPKGVPASDVGVYGDDIICPTNNVDDVIGGLHLCGFEVNTSKSFWQGPFRESCGHDYYMGYDVRPAYVKAHVSAETLFTLHNFFYRQYGYRDERACEVLELIPRHLRIYGPDGYGDGHLVSDEFVRHRSKRGLKKGYSGYSFETYSHTAIRIPSRYAGDWASPLYSVYVSADIPLTERRPLDFVRRQGRPKWPVPGSRGYRRTRIYTF